MNQSLVVLLESLVDYAGLFPPAALPIYEAVAKYEEYRKGKNMWALGRFVVPADRVADVPHDFPLSVLASESLPDADVIETKAGTSQELERIARARGNHTVYVETKNLGLLAAIKSFGLRAKIRTGGTTADAFPTIETVAAFIRACAEMHLPFKATAGLHHPIRCTKPLTYEADAPSGVMHGFLNVFMAAALPEHAEKILAEDNVRAFAFDEGGFWWRDLRVATDEIARVRQELFISFGSCSFEEPIADLKELGWL